MNIDVDKIIKTAEAYAERYGVKFFDIRIERYTFSTVDVENLEVSKVRQDSEVGMGVRALGKGWGFSSTSDIKEFESAIKNAMKLSKFSDYNVTIYQGDPIVDKAEIKERLPLFDISLEEKVDLGMKLAKEMQREYIKSVKVSYYEEIVEKLYLSSEGSQIMTKIPRVLLTLSAVARRGDIMQTYWKSVGGTGGFEIIKSYDVYSWAKKISEKAVSLLSAKSPPSGKMDVLIDPELAGVFIHEAIGHAAEGDAIKDNSSIFVGLLGKKVGVEELTVVDDPTLEGKFGSYIYDDEGQPGGRVEIIKNGILNSFLTDRESSLVLEMPPNGHGRAEDYGSRPLVRMSNTYIEPGDWKFEEMIEEMKRGVYMLGDKGGEVDIVNGTFTFGAKEGYLIENGEIKHQLRDVALSGKILEILKEIRAIGNDLRIEFPGYCGKGQWVPVDDGGPHVLLKAIVGGLQ
ncbi:TLDD - like protein [Pyrococcus furiosus DSM 3638]|uniref:TLDD protein homolog n=3 Tax=Pyrococcus furiosus TaxID=2261 RepID=Q8U4C8_PYRFU|nr:TldD/PmbA family protein [Pyrococcus furiosus]AAL80284.1 TLDD protein homolog [Pyrococcus furiosus DSM 3638]AFN04416.1 TLDD - like protein [Pyrococcus furiosus COM1]QEK77888.1 TLDD - like protein [Pyrococcus furiosus DSM 3638]